jgi:predicted nuclease with TOPRIM domain
MVLIIGLILSFIAIGVLYYLNNELKKKLENNNKALLALQKEFTQYQVDEKRVNEKNTARMEIRHDNIAKSIQKNENKVYALRKELPSIIGKVVGQIEFAQDRLNRK